jgi:pimeloyl-ACP methyl ester carboxylesterase
MKLVLKILFSAAVACTLVANSQQPQVSAAEVPPAGGVHTTCKTGVYESPSGGDILTMLPTFTRGLKFTFLDGRYGTTASSNPTAYCTGGAVYVKDGKGGIERWSHVPLKVTRTHFVSDGTTLAGLLVEPLAGSRTRPLLVHSGLGSNDHGWLYGETFLSHEPYLFAAKGISTFVYDRHGSGESAGKFHINFHRLARDLVAASEEARRLARGRYGRLGLYGISQGGWVSPLAAHEARADFMVINSSGVFSPLEEDASEVINNLRAKGHGEEILAKAREVIAAAQVIRTSNYLQGFEKLALVTEKYGNEPWFAAIDGDLTTSIVRASEQELRAKAGQNPMEMSWNHDSVAVLRRVSLPTLWVLAAEDRESPRELTIARLRMLQKEGKPIQVVTFPSTDHGIYEFTQSADGKRSNTRFSEGHYRLITDWINGQLSPPYGAAVPEPLLRSGCSPAVPEPCAARGK